MHNWFEIIDESGQFTNLSPVICLFLWVSKHLTMRTIPPKMVGVRLLLQTLLTSFIGLTCPLLLVPTKGFQLVIVCTLGCNRYPRSIMTRAAVWFCVLADGSLNVCKNRYNTVTYLAGALDVRSSACAHHYHCMSIVSFTNFLIDSLLM